MSKQEKKVLSVEEQERLDYRLGQYVQRNDLGGVKCALDDGANVNASCYAKDRRISPLVYAAANGSFEMMKLLLDRGRDVDVNLLSPTTETTALMGAVSSRYDSEKKISLLLDRGADINARDGVRDTALHLAIRLVTKTGALRIVQLLLDRGANPSIRNDEGYDAIAYAGHWQNQAVTNLFLQRAQQKGREEVQQKVDKKVDALIQKIDKSTGFAAKDGKARRGDSGVKKGGSPVQGG